jgi:predicted nucleotidyltransferase
VTEEITGVLEKLRSRFDSLYGERLVRLVLFGSHARGDAEPGSDIDVLVVLRGPVEPCAEIGRTIDAVAATSLDRDVVVACVFVSEEDFLREQSHLLLNVRREGVPV